MKFFLSRFINKTRTLKVNILTLFLSLISVSFLCVFSFTYSRDYKSIMQFSKGVAEQCIAVVLAKFQTIALASERVTKVSAGFFPEIEPLTISNKALLAYMLNVVKYDQNFSNFYIGLPDGSFIGAFNLEASVQKTFINQPSKLLPAAAAFALRYADKSEVPPMDNWLYLNSDFEEIAIESIPANNFDSRLRPWYVGAEKAGCLYWTGLYTFSPTLERGITIANPLYNAKGGLIAVIGADLTFALLSKFLFEQKIGKTGRAFILDETGQIIAPNLPVQTENPSMITPDLVSTIYQSYVLNPERSDFVIKFCGVEYLAYVTNLPVVFGSHWMIMTVAPLDDFFGQMIQMQQEVLGIILVILILSGMIVVYFAKRISSPIVTLADEVNKISQLELKSDIRVASNIKEILLIDNSIAAMRRVIRSFSRYVPKEIVRDLFKKKEEIVLGGEKKEVTIFFSDVAGFTSIAESHSIDIMIPLLSEYFDAMSKIILGSHGTIDKFLGDGIMAFWGAPIDVPDHASKACASALRCNAMLVELNRKRREADLPEFETRFGISTGTVIVGNIGTEDRMNYTVIGDAVNTTSRLQEVDKVYHTSIIISEDTYKRLGEEFVARPLDYVAIKGKKEKTRIYELVGKMDEEEKIRAVPEQIALCRAFTEAYEAMQRKDLNRAKALFLEIAKEFPEDFPTQLYLKRIEEYHLSGEKK